MLRMLLMLIAISTFIGTKVDAGFNNGDVFYCETDQFVGFEKASNYSLQRYLSERFKFQLQDDRLQFGEEGYFGGIGVRLDQYSFTKEGTYLGILRSFNMMGNTIFDGSRFTHTSNIGSSITVLIATCERF